MLWVPGDLAHKKKNSRVDPHPADRQGSPLNRKFTVRYRDSPNRNPTEHRTSITETSNFLSFPLKELARPGTASPEYRCYRQRRKKESGPTWQT